MRVWIGIVDHQSNCVRDNVGDRTEGLDAPLRRSRSIHDERLTDRATDPSAQPSERVDEPHCFGQPWCLAVDRRAGAFRREIAWTKPGATGSYDHPTEAGGKTHERRSNRLDPIFGYGSLDHDVAK